MSAAGDHAEWILNAPDPLESSENFIFRSRSLELALRGLAATHEPELSVQEYTERQTAAHFLITDTKSFFDDLKHSDFRCLYRIGSEPVKAHMLRQLGPERALFESGLVEPESWFELDYAEFHNVPQNCPQDLPHGLASPRQLFVGTTKSELAFSVHQMSLSFLNGGSWELGCRPMP